MLRRSEYLGRKVGVIVLKMVQTAASYIQAHAQLSSWNDELEFLGFILAELTDPRGLEANGFPWHQAADLPALVDILEHSCNQPNGILERLLPKQDRKRLRSWLLGSKQIRNAVAHHRSLSKAQLGARKSVRDELVRLLEFNIRVVAAGCGIREVCRATQLCAIEDAEQFRLGGVLIAQS